MNYTFDYPNHFNLPKSLGRLDELAYNLWWSWNPSAMRLYLTLDRRLWEKVNHNPIAMLRKVEHDKLVKASQDAYYMEEYRRVLAEFDAYMSAPRTWFTEKYPELKDKRIAYFSFEFGLHESIPFYAGGLGILSGDHLKEASDLGLPLIGVGFIYHQGYFIQKITEDGWQETGTYHFDFAELPLIAVEDTKGKQIIVEVDLPGRKVAASVWALQVGRVPLFLLDSSLEQNQINDRHLTARLYSSDLEIRISQEVLLGLGGVRALSAMGLHADVWHMNEGHSAFLTLERVRALVASGLSFDEAAAQVRSSNVFTTHTPVPAGNDQFPLWLIDKYFPEDEKALGISRQQFLDLGRQTQSWGDTFSMPVLAIKLSEYCNGVSELHGKVARQMWQFLWPEKKVEDVPITSITNGVHANSWVARRMGLLYERYLGVDWRERIDDPALWARVDLIPDMELWDVRRHLKRRLINFAIERARAHWRSGKTSASQVIAEGVMLDQYSLTIGFARRFATYKRADLLFQDYERLMRLINDIDYPVQIILAGKAHPADEPGKLLIQRAYRAAKDFRTSGRVVFLEDYDLNSARMLVQGVDVWLNTPRRPNEASGTSGMKAGLNGTLNFSVLDGWWVEGYNGKNGWAIGNDQDEADPARQDVLDSTSLMDTLENVIIPSFYNTRSMGDASAQWITLIKESIRSLAPHFNTSRMVKEYTRKMYLPAAGFSELDKK